MKHQITACGAVLLVMSSGGAFAHNNGAGGTVAPAAPAAHSSAPTTSAPHLNGLPHLSGMSHLSGANTYRPVITFGNSGRTLNYPPVRNSTLRQSNKAALNSGLALQHGSNFRPASNAIQKPHPLDPQTSARLRNWKGNISTAQQARVNNQNNLQHHHDHDWWKHHCVTFVFFDLGWWGWWDGWWYPAWGYDPYSYYEYQEPIYGYGGESPEQIVAGVQAALQQLGYYEYAIDGKMGQMTRSALARYQRDHHLPITSGIDQATLASLGILH
jgi:hypothetical protein